MRKSVYSIVLSDDVVAYVDRLAYNSGTSRSNMINQILAEYVSYVTPEKRLSDIFSRAVEMIESMDRLQVMLAPSDTMLSIKSALSYKYNPTVRYSVELYKTGEKLGQLRVTLRTQSAGLISTMEDFYGLWTAVEARELGVLPDSLSQGGKYIRNLSRPQSDSDKDVAQAIVDYVDALDRAMKSYFAGRAAGVDPTADDVAIYREYRSKAPFLI